MRTTFFWIALACVALPAPAQQDPFVRRQETLFSLPIGEIDRASDWTHNFRFGVIGGLNIHGDFKMSGTFKVANHAAQGIYDDGYVRQDNFPNSQGYTSYWGYEDAGQNDGTALTMHSATSFTASEQSSGRARMIPGIEMAYSDDFWYWGRMRIGFESGVSILPIYLEDNRQMTATVTNSVLSFQIPTGPNGTIELPDPPYHGGRDGIGPQMLLGGTPQSSIVDSSDTVTGRRTINAGLGALRLGPTVLLGVSENFAVSASAGPVIGVVAGQYRFNENIQTTFGQAHNQGHFTSADLVYGGYVNVFAVYHFVDNDRDACLFIGGQYMPMTSATFSSSGRSARVDLSGQVYLSAGIGWPF